MSKSQVKVPKTNQVNILGTVYQIVTTEEIAKEGFDGLCYPFDKIIQVVPYEMIEACGDKGRLNTAQFVLRHEIVHALFVESGWVDKTQDEELVDFIAYHIPTLVKIFRQVGAI